MVMSVAERTAPKGQFRVVGVDTFDGEDWVSCDMPRLDLAEALIKGLTLGKQMLKYHVYNDKGEHVAEEGSF